MGMSDKYMAYLLDNAVHEFGATLEAELSDIEGKNKREIKQKQSRVLSTWLDLPQKFRNPGMVGPGSKKQRDVEKEITVKGEPTL